MSHKPKVFAHKGGNVGVPENTLAAFRKSLELGVDGIEIDVHRCLSGELVVIHEPWLDATTNGSGHVADRTLAELRLLKAKVESGCEFADEKIPLLSEVLQLIDGRLILNIEVKNSPRPYPGIESDLIAELADYPHPHTVLISSFDHALLRRIHRLTRRYQLGMLLNGMLADVGDYGHSVGAKHLHPQFGNLVAAHVEVAHAGGLSVNTWTLNKLDEWQRAVDMRVDGIVTDDPERCQRFLAGIQDQLPPDVSPVSRRVRVLAHVRRMLLSMAHRIV